MLPDVGPRLSTSSALWGGLGRVGAGALHPPSPGQAESGVCGGEEGLGRAAEGCTGRA